MPKKEVEGIRIEDEVVSETKERVFARLCQLISENGNKVSVPFKDYDEIDESEEVISFVSSMPDFFDKELKYNMRAASVLERFLKQEPGDVNDYIGAIVNPELLNGKTLKCTEDDLKECVVFSLEG